MSIQAVLLPVFVQVLLTFALVFWSAFLRVSAINGGAVRPRDIALREPNWPAPVLKVGNSFQNQLELPLLFYVLTVIAWMTRQADLLFVVLAWVFVVLRLAHAAVHVTSNNFSVRGGLFITGALVLAVMWVIVAARVLLA
ncbi:MAG: MAPEG family protein [Hyphomicrobiales bacterium]|nr:MAPEG family protein [Hyphomicrobiales bacterium]